MERDPTRIEELFRWAKRQGHPDYLWSGVPIESWRACLLLIERATAAIMNGRGGARFDLPPESAIEAMGIAAFTAGMGPLLGFWVEQGTLTADPATEDLLLLHLEHGRRRAEKLSRELHRALDILSELGPVVLLKGAHTMHEYFPDPGTRPCADLDFAVPAARLTAAENALQANGYVRLASGQRPVKSEWQPPDAPTTVRSIDLDHADNPYTVELHGSLTRQFAGIGPITVAGDLEDAARAAPAISEHAYALREPHLIVYLALHIADELHRLQLLRVVELVLVIRRDLGDRAEGWSDLLRLVHAIRAARFVFAAFALAEQLCPGTIPDAVQAELRAHASPRLSKHIAAGPITELQRLESISLAERFLWTDGFAEKARRIASLLWPKDSHRPPIIAYRERLFRILRGRVRW